MVLQTKKITLIDVKPHVNLEIKFNHQIDNISKYFDITIRIHVIEIIKRRTALNVFVIKGLCTVYLVKYCGSIRKLTIFACRDNDWLARISISLHGRRRHPDAVVCIFL